MLYRKCNATYVICYYKKYANVQQKQIIWFLFLTRKLMHDWGGQDLKDLQSCKCFLYIFQKNVLIPNLSNMDRFWGTMAPSSICMRCRTFPFKPVCVCNERSIFSSFGPQRSPCVVVRCREIRGRFTTYSWIKKLIFNVFCWLGSVISFLTDQQLSNVLLLSVRLLQTQYFGWFWTFCLYFLFDISPSLSRSRARY